MRTQSRLRIAQLNIASLFETGWQKRRHEIVSSLYELRPDVMCFEEAHQSPNVMNTAGWIADAVQERTGVQMHWQFGGSEPVGTQCPAGTEFGSAILSRWPIDEFQYVRLPIADQTNESVAAFPWELVHARTAGLDVFAAHLAAAPQDGRHRRTQVKFIDQFVKSVRGSRDVLGHQRSTVPPILCGDFNAEPDSDEVRYLCGLTSLDGSDTFWQDAWRVAGDGSPGYTQDWRDNSIAATMNIHRKRIDYVFVGDPFYRRGSGGRVLDAKVAFHEQRTGIVASDHRGLVVDIVWPDRPAN